MSPPERLPLTLGEAARWWARRGFAVFPLQDRGKAPRAAAEVARVAGWEGRERGMAGGFRQASRDPETLRRWWRRWPQANIGGAVPAGRPLSGRTAAGRRRPLSGLGSYDVSPLA